VCLTENGGFFNNFLDFFIKIMEKRMELKELIKKENSKINKLIENCLRTIITYNYIKNIKFPLLITDIIYKHHKIENGSGIEILLDYIQKESVELFNGKFFKEGLSFE